MTEILEGMEESSYKEAKNLKGLTTVGLFIFRRSTAIFANAVLSSTTTESAFSVNLLIVSSELSNFIRRRYLFVNYRHVIYLNTHNLP